MAAIVGDDGSPQARERARRRIRGRVPLLSQRVQRLMRLAELGATGPDPEAALHQLRAAAVALHAFLLLTQSL